MNKSKQSNLLAFFLSVCSFILAYSSSSIVQPADIKAINSAPTELTTSSRNQAQRYPLLFVSNSRRVVLHQKINSHVRAQNSSVTPSPSPVKRPHNTKRKLKIWAIGFSVGLVVGMITGLLLFVVYRIIVLVKSRKNRTGTTLFSSLIKKEHLAFLENEEEVSSLPVIGEGTYGIVYKAPLQGSEDTILAIKKMKNEDRTQISSEIETVGRVRHKNLVPLLAHVPTTSFHYLVYEFMPNGNLQTALEEAAKGERTFDWATRLKIAQGISLGLEYLHSLQRPRIFHRDLKPANILLDQDMEAKIADFGLAKTLADDDTHVATIHPAGTNPYMDPEYYHTGIFTEKCDIYSFGMIIAGLVVGKLPGDLYFHDTPEFYILRWINNRVNSEDLLVRREAIDPRLVGNGCEEAMFGVLGIACSCTHERPAERPNAKQVKEMLLKF